MAYEWRVGDVWVAYGRRMAGVWMACGWRVGAVNDVPYMPLMCICAALHSTCAEGPQKVVSEGGE